MKATAILPGNPGHHAVEIYDDDRTLCGSIADFLADGLAASQPTLVVATARHCELILEELGARRFSVPTLLASGALAMVDAHELLPIISSDRGIDPARFREVVGLAMDRVIAAGNEPVVRVYGEVVDLLWRDGKVEAALHLESLWNELFKRYSFSLLCGYSKGPFLARPEHEEVCACHTHVHYGAGH